MFGRYLRRELLNRKKQTTIIAIGMALAIALVILVSAVSAGVKNAQAEVLKSVYGVGTDVTVTKTATRGSGTGGPQQFDVGAGDGTTSGSGSSASRSISQGRLSVSPGTGTLTTKQLASVASTAHVSAASGVLALTNTKFSGTLPNFAQGSTTGRPGSSGSTTTAPTGGSNGAGGSSFSVTSFTVLGVNPASSSAGPLSAVAVTTGKGLTTSDNGKDVAVVDATYAKTKKIAVGDTVTLGSTKFTVVGLVASTSSSSSTASDVYIPLDVAQSLSGETGKLTSIYVTADSSSNIATIKSSLGSNLSKVTVSTESDLASNVSGSLGSASSLIANLGTWLSIAVLAAAFVLAILFTISGVTRRTREFGTLKAIGWSNRRIVGQVAGESVVQGLIGGVIGLAVGLGGVLVVNVISPSLSATVSSSSAAATPVAAASAAAGSSGTTAQQGPPGGFGGAQQVATTASDIVLHAPVELWIIAAAIGLAVLGGLLAGVIGGWRASRLRPAAALRSVA